MSVVGRPKNCTLNECAAGHKEREKSRGFEKRKVSAKDERLHEKRKVSRENREVPLLIKWPANNLNTLNVWPAKDKDLEQFPRLPISVKASF